MDPQFCKTPTNEVVKMMMQHEERIYQLEKGKPILDKLGDYTDVRAILWELLEKDTFVKEFKTYELAEAYVCVYLQSFVTLHNLVKVYQHEDILRMWGLQQFKRLSRWIYYAVRCNTTINVPELLRQAPFVRQGESGGGGLYPGGQPLLNELFQNFGINPELHLL
jgi:hypothetical protein